MDQFSNPQETKIQGYSTDKQKLDLQIIRKADELALTMRTKGWKETAQNILDSMIKDSLGYKQEDGIWNHGSAKMSDYSIQEIVAYRNALMDFNNNLMAVLQRGDLARKRRENYENKKTSAIDQTPRYSTPMFDTSYSEEKEN